MTLEIHDAYAVHVSTLPVCEPAPWIELACLVIGVPLATWAFGWVWLALWAPLFVLAFVFGALRGSR